MFIYVNDKRASEILEHNGYELIKSNEKANLWCHYSESDIDDEKLNFSMDFPYVVSSVLVF